MRSLSTSMVALATLALALSHPSQVAAQDPAEAKIRALALKLTAGVTGAEVGLLQSALPFDASARWQRYANGLIFASDISAALWITPGRVGELWEAERATLGAPQNASRSYSPTLNKRSCLYRKRITGTVTRCANGSVVHMRQVVLTTTTTVTRSITGPIYQKWFALNGVQGPMGPPSNRVYKGSGARAHSFVCGFLVENSENSSTTPVALYITDSIGRTHQTDLWKVVGDPVGNILTMRTGAMQRFKLGNLYATVNSSSVLPVLAGVPAIPGVPPILDTYESKYGGPAGPLGGPVAGIKTITVAGPGGIAHNVSALDCLKGTLVAYPPAADNSGGPPWNGTEAFTSLSVYLNTFRTSGCDTRCSKAPFGKQDPYFSVALLAQMPVGSMLTTVRIPPLNTLPQNYYINQDVVVVHSTRGLMIPKVQSTTVFKLTLSAYDVDIAGKDGARITKKDFLGQVTNTLDISTGWGAFRGLFSASASSGKFKPEYRIQRAAIPVPIG